LLPVREPMWAIVFKPWDNEPVYHRYGGDLATVCGRRVGLHKSMWPFKHAKKVGRPCKGCFPGE